MATRTIANAGGNWNTASTWVENQVPTSADDVVATATSGNLTVENGSVCRSLDLSLYVGTLGSTNNLSIGDGTVGHVVLGTGMTSTMVNSLHLVSTTGPNNITTNGKLSSRLRVGFNNTGNTGTFVLQDNITNQFIEHHCGNLDTNGKTVSDYRLQQNGNAKTLTLGASSITITTNLFVNSSGLSAVTAGTSTLTFGSSSPGGDLGSFTWYDIDMGGSSNTFMSLTGSFSCHNLTIPGRSNPDCRRAFANGATVTVSGTLTCNGNSSVNRTQICSTTQGSAVTINAAATTLSNVDFQDITATGAASWSSTISGDCGGNSGTNPTTPTTRYWVGNGGNFSSTSHWSTASGGSSGASIPLPQDNVIFDANSISSSSQTITMDYRNVCKNFDASAVTNNPSFAFGGPYVQMYGDFTLGASTTLNTGSGSVNLNGRGTHTINVSTSGSISGSSSLQIFAAPSGTYSLVADLDLKTMSTLFLGSGTFDAAGYNVTVKAVNGSGFNTRTMTMGSGNWTITGTSGTIWDYGTTTGLTHNAGTGSSVLTISDNGNSDKTFNGNGKSFRNISISSGGTGKVIFSTSMTMNALAISAPKSVRFQNGQTFTITTPVQWKGTAGNLITIDTPSAGNFATLSTASGNTNCDYLSLKDSKAQGGATWYAGVNSTNVSGNTGWSFTNAPSATSRRGTSTGSIGTRSGVRLVVG